MISVQLDWKPNAQFAGLLVADHGGLFAERKLKVEIIPWQVHTDPVAGLETPGRIAVSEDNLAIRSCAAGNDVIVLGAMLRSSPLAWIVRADSPLTSFADFAGTTVGVHVDGVTGLDYAMRSAGLTLADVNVVDVPYDKTTQLLNGDIDACQCNGLVEPVEMRAEGADIRVLWARDAGYEVYSQVLSTSRTTYQQSPELVDGFMQALWEGWVRALTDTDVAASTIVDHYLHESTVKIQQEILEAERPWVLGEADSGATLGGVDELRLQASIDLLHAHAFIPDRLDARRMLLPPHANGVTPQSLVPPPGAIASAGEPFGEG